MDAPSTFVIVRIRLHDRRYPPFGLPGAAGYPGKASVLSPKIPDKTVSEIADASRPLAIPPD